MLSGSGRTGWVSVRANPYASTNISIVGDQACKADHAVWNYLCVFRCAIFEHLFKPLHRSPAYTNTGVDRRTSCIPKTIATRHPITQIPF